MDLTLKLESKGSGEFLLSKIDVKLGAQEGNNRARTFTSKVCMI